MSVKLKGGTELKRCIISPWKRFPPCSCCTLVGPVVPQVPPQPLWFAPGLANVRKLQELPYHLLHAGLWEELRQEVVGKLGEEARGHVTVTAV